MKMLLISNSNHNKECEKYILASAKERNIEVEIIDAKNTLNSFNPVTEKTLLYRISIAPEDRLLEHALLSKNTISFRERPDAIYNTQNKFYQYVCFSNANIPAAKTIYSKNVEQKSLKNIAKEIGFPMVLKLIDGTHGVGVMIVDSFQSLKSIAEVLVEKNIEFVFQEFIKEAKGKSFRVIVLDGKAIGSIEYNSDKEDFRSNASDSDELNVNTTNINPEIEKISVQAIQSLGVNFGGVDLLPANNKEGYIVAEANFPCNFARTQACTNIDISGMILDYLIEKYKKSE